MWPLSSKRSITLRMSKAGNWASCAPMAMFSRSRKTAMVASESGKLIGMRQLSRGQVALASGGSVRLMLFQEGMQPTTQPRSRIVRPTFKRAVAEAEKETNALNLERARIANDFVANALKPARSAYARQHLPQADAGRERQRCKAVRVRLA